MNELHLFAGVGGGILGGILLGHTTVCAVELEPYCRRVLLQRQRDGILPKFPIWGDVTTFDGKPWRGKVDVVCGGFPCQDISIAGKGDGINGGRSGLWGEMARIVSVIQPKYIFVENSPMLTVRGLGRVIGDISELGYNARWGVLGGHSTGNCCDGKRIWILANEANSFRWSKAQIQSRKFDKSESRGRQFDRAVGACLSAEAHTACLRDSNAISRDVDRLKSIGNAQVPILAATAFRILKGK